jgi:hypothetical protein
MFALSALDGRGTDPAGAADINHLHPGIGFLEGCHDLAFRESALFDSFLLGVFQAQFSTFKLYRLRGNLR